MAAHSEQQGQHQAPLWRLEEVSFAYRGKPVLEGINCQIRPGRCTGILGPNGSGKSTLLDLLAGLLRPQGGQILFQGKPIEQFHRRGLARSLALVPQNFRISFDFSVREVVEMGLHPHLKRFALPSAADCAQVDAIMAQTGILALAERPVTRLSGGEQQRVAVARALVQRPQALLLDEATASLDIRHSLALLRLLRQRVDAGVFSVVAVLHDLNLAARFCDELILFHNGKCHAQGPSTEVLHPRILEEVYGVESEICYNPFTQSQQVSLRLPDTALREHPMTIERPLNR